MEVGRINTKVNAMYHTLKKKADDDAAQMGVGMVLFWPALFFLEGGDGVEAQQYAQYMGELDALETVAIQKECAIDFPERVRVVEEKTTTKRIQND